MYQNSHIKNASDISKENFDRQSLYSFDSGIGTSYSGQRYKQETTYMNSHEYIIKVNSSIFDKL